MHKKYNITDALQGVPLVEKGDYDKGKKDRRRKNSEGRGMKIKRKKWGVHSNVTRGALL